MIVDSAIYVDGRRSAPCPLDEIHRASRARGGFAYIGLYEPTREEFDSVAGEFGLHELAIKDAVKPHQRPKVERYGDTFFVGAGIAAVGALSSLFIVRGRGEPGDPDRRLEPG